MADYNNFFKRQWPLFQSSALFLPWPNATFANPSFDAADLRVLIVRLSPFRDVDRSTPHLFLFQAVRRALPDAYVDMAFFPPRHDRERLEVARVPLLVGTQSWRSAEDFDLLLISNAYTLELVNLPYLLLRSGVPLLSSQRDGSWPILILGGSNAMAAQAVVTEDGDSLVDAIFFGEGEDSVGALVRYMRDNASLDRRERLLGAAALVQGLWVAGDQAGEPVEKAVLSLPATDHLLVDYPLLNGDEAGTARLQINYGCPAFCSFCFEGYDRKPYREMAREAILQTARRLKLVQGCETLALYSFNFNTHREILALFLELNQLFERVSFTSQRLDVLDATPGLLEAEVIADKRSFTLGVEGISARLRAWLHKSLADEAIIGSLERLLGEKVREIKLFYILTGHETELDLAEFRTFVRQLKALRRRKNPGVRIIFSCGLLVRMPFTPLRHDRLFLDPDEWRAISGPVKSICETNGFEFRLAVDWEEYATSQVLAIGGYWLHKPLVALAEEGHCYDEKLTPGYWEALKGRIENRGHWTAAFLGEKEPDYPFPFRFVRSNVPSEFLYEQYEQSKACVDEGYCLGSRDVQGHCLGCGACVDREQRRAITEHQMRLPDDGRYLRRLEETMRRKRRLQPQYVRLRLPSIVAGTSPEWMNAWVLRETLAACPELVDNLLYARESLFATRENQQRYPGFYGETVFALKAWDASTLVEALAGVEGDRSGYEILSLAEGFEPGRFRKARLSTLLPTEDFPNAGQRLLEFLRAAYVPCNVRREGAGFRFDLPAKALKKRVLLEARYEQIGGGLSLDLVVGPKFDLGGFLCSFGEPGQHLLARVAVSELEW